MAFCVDNVCFKVGCFLVRINYAYYGTGQLMITAENKNTNGLQYEAIIE